MRTVGLVVHQRLDRQEHARERMRRVPARADPRAQYRHTHFPRPIQVRVEADATLARRQVRARRVFYRIAVRVLHPKMEEAAVVGRALGPADDAVHRRRHGFSLFGEEARRVVASDRRHISCYSLEAAAGRRCRRGGLAPAEPVEEGSHLSSAACDLSCSPTSFFGRAARLCADGCLVMLDALPCLRCSPGSGAAHRWPQ